MKEDFLPIPDAPNYEINSQLVCRNKKTGQILKPYMERYNETLCYSVRRANGRAFHRTPEFFRRVAEAAATDSTFEPIPSLDCRYEINNRGKVRNAKTKQIIQTKRNGKCVPVRAGGKYIMRSIADLLWEVHGQFIKRRFRPVPCSCENQHGKFFFTNLRDCARFLAPKVFYSVRWINCRLVRREPIIEGWKITYYENNFGNVKWNTVSLNALARHHLKMLGE